MSSPTSVTSAVMLALPVPLLLTGLLAGVGADKHPRLIRRFTTFSATYALVSAFVAAMGYAFSAQGSETYASVTLPANLGAASLSVYVDPLTMIMLLLVTFVGLIVARYSSSYMEGEVHEGQFHRWLSFTLASFLTLIMTSNFWGFIVASFATTIFLGQLLSFYKQRPGAVLAARKKTIFTLTANTSMLLAFVLVARVLHTSDFGDLRFALSHFHRPMPLSLEVAAGLVALSAVLRSAQFPTHGWLIQVMEAPTPVSALLHAGIIYTGTFLVLRMSPLMSRIGWTGVALVLVGLVSIVAGSTMMMTSTAIKASLAYSTLAQMGFMLMECGLGVYSVAVLHIVSHSVYKAHAFLSSGSVVENFREPALPAVFNAGSVRRALLGLVVAVAMTVGIGSAFGVLTGRQRAVLALGLVVSLAVTHLLLQALNTKGSGSKALILWMGLLSAGVVTAYFALHRAFGVLLAPSLPSAIVPSGIAQDILLALIVAVFIGLLAVQQMLPRIMKKPAWRAVYVHLYNGLYVDLFFTRLLCRTGSAGRRAEGLDRDRREAVGSAI
ncbi:MAG: proton-conducting transporter membrane subunit [Actinomycetota bacterium]|nr:proton-conducting transporter membrane subunit [Actinomycetota bacterium]